MSVAPISLATVSDVIPTTLVVPPVDYTSRDYASLINDLLNLIPSYLPEWTDRSPGDFGIVLLELFAYVGDILNYYSDRIANESFIGTAQQRQSVLNLANLLDYTPHNNVSASVLLQFQISSPSPPVLIPGPKSPGGPTQVSTTLVGNQSLVFETTQDLWIYGDGVSITRIWPATGVANQQFVLGNDGYPYPTYIYNGSVNQTVVVGTLSTDGVTILSPVSYTLAPGNSLVGQAATALMYTVINVGTVTAPSWALHFGGATTSNPGQIPALGLTVQAVYQPAAPSNYTGSPVPAIQGRSTVGEGVAISDGTPGQSYTLFGTPVVDGSIVVYVDEGNGPKAWMYFQRLVDAASSANAFTYLVNTNSVVTIQFGDSIAGRIPPPGSFITADYIVGGGVIGNVAPGSLTNLMQGPSAITSVTNPQAASGGADAESTDHIRIHAPLSITAINRAVSLDDYAALTLNIPSIAKAAAMSTDYNAVNVYIHPTGDFFAYGNDTNGITTLTNRVNALIPTVTNSAYTGYLDDKKMVGVSVNILPPQYFNQVTQVFHTGYVPINVVATVQVLDNYHQQAVNTAVVAAIQNLFLFSVVDFSYNISLSSVYHACMNVEGVDYVNITGLYRNEYSSGLGDPVSGGGYTGWINCAAYEIPQAYQVTVTANGGIPF